MYTQSKSERTLYILSGGYSSRMGSHKMNLRLGDKTFLSHMEEKAATIFNDVVVLGANHQVDSIYQVIPDSVPDAGPLGGLLAALQHTTADSIAIVPVDLPQISVGVIRSLRDLTGGEYNAILARSINRLQPLVGIYKKKLTNQLIMYLKSEKRSVMGFINTVEYSTFDVSEKDIVNVNTPEDYKTLLAKL